MPSHQPIKPSAGVAGALLAIACALLWVPVVSVLSDFSGGDAAGTAMTEGFAAIGIVLLYVPIAALALVAALGGDMPPSGRFALIVLVPASLCPVFAAFSLLEQQQLAPGLWPLAIPVGAPPLIVLYCLWALTPLHAYVSARVANVVVWGGVGLLCLALLPLFLVRDRANQRVAANIADWQTKFDATPADAPLAQWLPFLDCGVYPVEQAATRAILALPRRQSDAEAMLDRDEFDFDKLDRFDLDPTPVVCDKARASLMRRAAALASPSGPRGLQEIIDEVNGAARGMKWLVDFTCGCDRESLAWEALARSHGVPESILGDLAGLRDPEEFGRILYNYPPRFSMLTPKAKLGAWLHFAAAPGASVSQIDAALAGARKLDHRTADAVEWLSDPHREGDRFELMRLLPELDVEATPQLCASGLSWVRAQVTRTYRPTPSEPESYRGLEIRLGVGQPLVALQWFAKHGCDAEAELTVAESLIRAYGDSPQRTAMLDSLAALHRKP